MYTAKAQVFSVVFRGKSHDARHMARKLGVRDAESFERKRRAMEAAALALPNELVQALVGDLSSSPWKLKPRVVSWPLVFVHICEHQQVLAGVGAQKLALACARVCPATTAALQRMSERLRDERLSTSQKCHTVYLTEAVLGVIGGADPRPSDDGLTSLRRPGDRPSGDGLTSSSSFAPVACSRKRLRVKTAAKVPKKGKDTVTCDRCGKRVRRDVLARHRRSEFCKHRGLEAPNMTKYEETKCIHCGSHFFGTQWKRHLASAKCTAARGMRSIDASGAMPSGVGGFDPAQVGCQAQVREQRRRVEQPSVDID